MYSSCRYHSFRNSSQGLFASFLPCRVSLLYPEGPHWICLPIQTWLWNQGGNVSWHSVGLSTIQHSSVLKWHICSCPVFIFKLSLILLCSLSFLFPSPSLYLPMSSSCPSLVLSLHASLSTSPYSHSLSLSLYLVFSPYLPLPHFLALSLLVFLLLPLSFHAWPTDTLSPVTSSSHYLLPLSHVSDSLSLCVPQWIFWVWGLHLQNSPFGLGNHLES